MPWLMIDTYDSMANLQNFRHPICVVRGDKDETVPPAQVASHFGEAGFTV